MSEQSITLPEEKGMGRVLARRLEYGLVLLCLLALAAMFQPFSKILYGMGAGLIVFAGLAFNLMPFCTPETSLKKIRRISIIVAVIFVVVVILAIGSAELYGVYIRHTR